MGIPAYFIFEERVLLQNLSDLNKNQKIWNFFLYKGNSNVLY